MIAVMPAYYLLSPKKLIYLFLPNLPFLLLWLFHCLFLKKANQLILPLVAFLTNLGLINLLQIDESFFLAQLKNLYCAFLLSVLIIIANFLKSNNDQHA
jgi:hypothetical protein